LKDLNVPVFGTCLTIGLILAKLKEAGLGQITTNEIKPRDKIKLGMFKIEFINGSHSIPGSIGIAIRTPLGTIVHTGDFKLDHTPVSGGILDIHKYSELGNKGVLCLLSDSTNVELPGFTQSEMKVGQNIDEAFSRAAGRIIFASFASNINRLQQAFSAACKYKRKVAAVGRSMVNVIRIAAELGYLDIPKGVQIDINGISGLAANEVCILTTGSQGEPMAALTRMARNEHRRISISAGDTIIISANPIPGNERAVAQNINQLFKLGAKVIYESVSGMHVSGHASQEELKLMLSMLKPRYFIPVHGEYRMLMKHAELAEQLGICRDNIFIAEIGNVIEFTRHGARITDKVTGGRTLIDGLGVGDVGNIVLNDRKQLSRDGVLIVVATIDSPARTIKAGPEVITRGFVYVRQTKSLLDEVREIARGIIVSILEDKNQECANIKIRLKNSLSEYLYDKTGRRPIIIPILLQVG
jgi:ribonuclease J